MICCYSIYCLAGFCTTYRSAVYCIFILQKVAIVLLFSRLPCLYCSGGCDTTYCSVGCHVFIVQEVVIPLIVQQVAILLLFRRLLYLYDPADGYTLIV
jgi:hypothetical protein